MKLIPPLIQHYKSRLFRSGLKGRKSVQVYSTQGFTLVELLVAGIISAVVILVAWSGLVSAMNMSQVAQARSARQMELNQALDFITNEIRMARAINQSATLTANGTTVTLSDVVTSAGVNLANLGSYGTLGLYLERPTRPDIPAICPVGGPNAGAPPPAPADFDPIVYDIRPSPSSWLQPRMLVRYGRAPSPDGTINACNNPISSDPIIDALSTTAKTMPTCPGVLAGDGGFYSCTNGNQVNLFFQSDVSNVEARQISSAVSSRVNPIAPQTQSSLILIVTRSGNEADLSWTYTGNPAEVDFYEIGKEVKGTKSKKIKGKAKQDKDDLFTVTPGESICYQVEAVLLSGASPVQSNQGCITK